MAGDEVGDYLWLNMSQGVYDLKLYTINVTACRIHSPVG